MLAGIFGFDDEDDAVGSSPTYQHHS
jgi:hypothetical protein